MAKKCIIGVDLGGTFLRVALIDSRYKIKKKEVLKTRRFTKRESLIQAIADSIDKIIRNNSLGRNDILGVGLGLPGPVDTVGGLVQFLPNIPGWKRVSLKYILERKLKFPVFIDNDANLMSLAEYRLGAAKGLRNVVCLTLGTGVGGGIVIDGKLYRGSSGAAGEIGHIPINENGPRCNCGGIACLEAYIGNKKIIKEARGLFGKDISLEQVSLLAKRKNKKAISMWSEVGRQLGVALTGITNLLNPDAIVIGGGVAQAGKVLFDRVRKTIAERAMSVQAKQVKVLRAKLGNNAGLLGAAILVKEAAA